MSGDKDVFHLKTDFSCNVGNEEVSGNDYTGISGVANHNTDKSATGCLLMQFIKQACSCRQNIL